MGYVVIVQKAAGNESVGTEWEETYEFDGNDTLTDIMRAIYGKSFGKDEIDYTRERIILTLSQDFRA